MLWIYGISVFNIGCPKKRELKDPAGAVALLDGVRTADYYTPDF
jgi:hypothetical protein